MSRRNRARGNLPKRFGGVRLDAETNGAKARCMEAINQLFVQTIESRLTFERESKTAAQDLVAQRKATISILLKSGSRKTTCGRGYRSQSSLSSSEMLATDRVRWVARMRIGQYVQNSGQLRLASKGNPPPSGRPAKGTMRRGKRLAVASRSHRGNGNESRSATSRLGQTPASRSPPRSRLNASSGSPLMTKSAWPANR
jgi:hypothetical protein